MLLGGMPVPPIIPGARFGAPGQTRPGSGVGAPALKIPFPAWPSRYKLRSMLKTLIFCLKLAIVFGGIVFFGRAIQYLIFNGGFSGEFYDYLFMRK